MENLNTALLLMVVGMTTVFAILLIVIYLGKGLILLVNKSPLKRWCRIRKVRKVLPQFPETFWLLSVRCNSGDTRQG